MKELITKEELKEIMSNESSSEAENGYNVMLLAWQKVQENNPDAVIPKYIKGGPDGPDLTRSIGVERSISVGDRFIVLGGLFMCPIVSSEGKTTSMYPAIPVKRVKDGTEFNLSFAQIMGIATDKNFSYVGTFINEYYVKDEDDNDVKLHDEIVASSESGFDFSRVWQPATRELYPMVAKFMALGDKIKDSELTYIAFACRQRTARRDSPAGSFENYRAGYQRVESHRLFAIKWIKGVEGISK